MSRTAPRARRAGALFAAAVAAFACAPWAAPLHAQAVPSEFRLRKCDAPRQPLGVLSGQGQVLFELDRDGRPDSGSVRVVRSDDLSPAAFRSAAVRLLTACRFEIGGQRQRTPVRVIERIIFHDSTAELRTPQAAPDSVQAGPMGTAAAPIGGPVEQNDPRLEERPRKLQCEAGRGPRPLSGETYRSAQDFERQMGEIARENTGTVEARIVVGADGRVARRDITVVNSTNPRVTNGIVDALASCRYAPGRIAGVPVAVVVTQAMGVEVRIERINP